MNDFSLSVEVCGVNSLFNLAFFLAFFFQFVLDFGRQAYSRFCACVVSLCKPRYFFGVLLKESESTYSVNCISGKENNRTVFILC